MENCQDKLLCDDRLKIAASRRLRGNEKGILYANIHNVPTAVETARLVNEGAANPLVLQRFLKKQLIPKEDGDDRMFCIIILSSRLKFFYEDM